MRAVLSRDTDKDQGSGQPKNEKDLKNDLDFLDWYQDLENGLLNASHDEYWYVMSKISSLNPWHIVAHGVF